jgi:thymidine kinase
MAMGKIKKGVLCNIAGCTENALRSLSKDSISKALSGAGLQVKGNSTRVYVCEKHYKTLKKQMKKARKEDLMRLERPF